MAYRSSASGSATSGNVSATPAGIQAHDYFAAWCLIDDSAAGLTRPTGWNAPTTVTWSTPDGSRLFFSDKNDASGSETSADFTFAKSAGSSNTSLNTVALSGRNNTTPRSTAVVSTTDQNSNTSAISATLTGITAAEGDDVLIGWGTDQTVAGARWTASTITNYTERQDGVAQDWVSGIGLQTRDNVSAGATGNFSVTLTRTTGTGNAGYGAIVAAIAAAAGGGATRYVNRQILSGVG